KSTSLKADVWHHRRDAITSVAAFVGISIAWIFGKGYEAADDWAALFASGFILYNAYLIFRPALGEIMDENVHQELIANIRKISLTVEGVIATEKCFIRKTGLMYQVDLHITVDANLTVKEGHAIAHQLKDVLMHEIPEVSYVLIHVEPNN
ncbi:MAG TPA: cation-efflux pump, partial [Cytophagales bacterium]|nr:cation-efflux pump [Cytophagales bacterium]